MFISTEGMGSVGKNEEQAGCDAEEGQYMDNRGQTKDLLMLLPPTDHKFTSEMV